MTRYVFTIELRPSESESGDDFEDSGFILDKKHIKPMGEEIWSFLMAYAEELAKKKDVEDFLPKTNRNRRGSRNSYIYNMHKLVCLFRRLKKARSRQRNRMSGGKEAREEKEAINSIWFARRPPGYDGGEGEGGKERHFVLLVHIL